MTKVENYLAERSVELIQDFLYSKSSDYVRGTVSRNPAAVIQHRKNLS